MNWQKPQVKKDRELLKQIARARAGKEDVQAVFRLRPSDPSQKFVSPEQTEGIVNQLMKRVEQETGSAPRNFNIFRNLGTFVVVASADFVSKVMEQHEVASAIANQQPTGMFIPPRDKRPL